MSAATAGGGLEATPTDHTGDEVRRELEARALAGAGRQAALDDIRAGMKSVLVAARRMRGRETRLHGQKLSYAQFGLLHAMSEQPCQSARDLATHADLTPGTVTQMLDSLEAVGLVERSRSTEDKRVVLTKLTDQGRELLTARKHEIDARWATMLDEFSDDDLRATAAVLEVLATYFDDPERESPAAPTDARV